MDTNKKPTPTIIPRPGTYKLARNVGDNPIADGRKRGTAHRHTISAGTLVRVDVLPSESHPERSIVELGFGDRPNLDTIEASIHPTEPLKYPKARLVRAVIDALDLGSRVAWTVRGFWSVDYYDRGETRYNLVEDALAAEWGVWPHDGHAKGETTDEPPTITCATRELAETVAEILQGADYASSLRAEALAHAHSLDRLPEVVPIGELFGHSFGGREPTDEQRAAAAREEPTS